MVTESVFCLIHQLPQKSKHFSHKSDTVQNMQTEGITDYRKQQTELKFLLSVRISKQVLSSKTEIKFTVASLLHEMCVYIYI